MGIYIKGMEMPERCWDCDLCYDSFYCRPLRIQFSDMEDFEPAERRLSDCPLVPVPKHGRLIDADALGKRIKAEGTNQAEQLATRFDPVVRAYGDCYGMVLSAPTIIEAEDEE